MSLIFHRFGRRKKNSKGNSQPPANQNTSTNMSLTFKRTAITNDYVVTQKSLGLGINGKVLECHSKANNEKYALKVNFFLVLEDDDDDVMVMFI